MAEIEDLDTTDASNTARFPENQAPSTVNDGARALEGILARFHEDLGCRKASTGSANAYVFAAAQTLSAYYDGQLIGFDANFANTGAATLNVDAIGAKTIKKLNDQDLVSGDIEAGQKVLAIYDGTNFQLLSPTARGGSPITTRGDVVRGSSTGAPERLATGAADTFLGSDGTDTSFIAAATQAEQETGTATNKPVTPGRQNFHPSAVKFWCKFDGSAAGPITPDVDFNVVDVTDTGTGDHTVNIETDFSGADWAPFGMAGQGVAGANAYFVGPADADPAAGTIRVNILDSGGNLKDAEIVSIGGLGDQ